jgi:hypothetical protein
MESIIAQPVQDGEKEKTYAEVISLVLPQHKTFLENVGLKISSSKKSRFGVSSQVQVLQSEFETEKQESTGLRQEVYALTSQAEESEIELAEQLKEIDSPNLSSADFLQQWYVHNLYSIIARSLSNLFSVLKFKFCHSLLVQVGYKKIIKAMIFGQHEQAY